MIFRRKSKPVYLRWSEPYLDEHGNTCRRDLTTGQEQVQWTTAPDKSEDTTSPEIDNVAGQPPENGDTKLDTTAAAGRARLPHPMARRSGSTSSGSRPRQSRQPSASGACLHHARVEA